MNLESFGSFSLTAIVLFCAGWLVKKWLEAKIKADVEHQYEKELAQFKNDLESSKEKEIAKLNSELNQKTQTAIASLTSQFNIIEAQNNVRFSKIFEKTATVIADIYTQLLDLHETANNYTELTKDKVEENILLDRYNEKLPALILYYTRNRLYLHKDTAKKVETCFKTIHRSVMEYNREKAGGKIEWRDPEEIVELLKVLHDDFQKHLGVAKEMATQLASPESQEKEG